MVLMILVALAFCVGAGIVVAGYFGAIQVPGMVLQRKLDQRLQEISMPEAPVSEDGESQGLLKTRHEGMMPALDRIVGGTARGSALSHWIDQSGVKTSLSTVLLIAAGCAGLFAILFKMLIGAPLALVLGAALGFSVPFIYLNFKRGRRMRKFEEEFPEALDLIARALKAGHAFVTGLKMVADEMEDPVGPEFRKTFDEQNFGLPMKDALENLTTRVPSL